MGRIEIGKSSINKYANLKDFVRMFVLAFFTTRDGKLRNIPRFEVVFGIPLIEDVITSQNLLKRPTAKTILKYSVQKKPIISYKKKENLNKLRLMSISDIKRELNPRGKFNPHLTPRNESIALNYATNLVRIYSKSVDLKKRLQLSSLIQQLQRTKKLGNVLDEIRNVTLSSPTR